MQTTDAYTTALLDDLYARETTAPTALPETSVSRLKQAFAAARETELTQPIVDFFVLLREVVHQHDVNPQHMGFTREQLEAVADRHARIDEHGVTVGGRVHRAMSIARQADDRAAAYMAAKDRQAPSGIQLWDRILENQAAIRQRFQISESAWNTFSGQMKHAIDSIDDLAGLIGLPARAVADVLRVTRSYRMRLTPYYASLIMPGETNDPILLQSVPTAEMVDNVGEELSPVAADHSPARLVDQFYPRVVTIKATNMCAMYCTHCLRIAHIGKKDRIYPKAAYEEALDYIRRHEAIRDVLITGGDAFILPNDTLRWLLDALDGIDHVRIKRLGTRIPVTAPMRIDDELLDLLEASNDRKPVRVVTQINTAREITPVSREGFRRISKRVTAVLNQAVLLKGINDSRVKMWKMCETIQESYVRPYYVFNCSYRNPQFSHFRVPIERGRDIIEGMYGNISGDAIPRYIATAGGKVPLHRDNVTERTGGGVMLKKPWSGETVFYPDADPDRYAGEDFGFGRYEHPAD